MADDKQSRDKQAHDAERRQQERELDAALERADEPRPPIDETDLGEVEAELEGVSFPATGRELVAVVGDRTVESPEGSYAVGDLLPDTDVETFDAPASVTGRIQRPTVAAAMKRILEAAETLPDETLKGSQWTAYDRTFQELEAIDAVDDDEGIDVIADWVVGRIHEKGTLPGSRAVRREAAKLCRTSGYEIRNDEWLGV
jgi:hypothetical protein